LRGSNSYTENAFYFTENGRVLRAKKEMISDNLKLVWFDFLTLCGNAGNLGEKKKHCVFWVF
jgi:hypothetical protein